MDGGRCIIGAAAAAAAAAAALWEEVGHDDSLIGSGGNWIFLHERPRWVNL